MIYKSELLKKHIDLDRLLTVSDVRFVDMMGSGGWFVEFDLLFQLQDKPVVYSRRLDDSEQRFTRETGFQLAIEDEQGNVVFSPYHVVKTNLKIVAVKNLQREVNELVYMWKHWRLIAA